MTGEESQYQEEAITDRQEEKQSGIGRTIIERADLFDPRPDLLQYYVNSATFQIYVCKRTRVSAAQPESSRDPLSDLLPSGSGASIQ